MATEHASVGVRRKVKLLVPISGRPVVVSWSDFTVALSQAVRVRLALQTARSRTRESVRCTKSPRPTWRVWFWLSEQPIPARSRRQDPDEKYQEPRPPSHYTAVRLGAFS